MKYYLPTTSKNFNNIFSTESISPHSFYRKRMFGIKRHFQTKYSISEDYLCFYPFPIYYRMDEGFSEEYPVIFEMDKKELNEDDCIFKKTDFGEVLLFPKTIFLNTLSTFKVLFYTEDEKNIVVANSESSLEVKTTFKYEKYFHVIKSSDLTEPPIPKIDIGENFQAKNEIIRDKLFNHYKGLIYGYFVGQLDKKESDEIEFFESIQTIIDAFGNMRTGIGINQQLDKYSSRKKNKRSQYSNYNKSENINQLELLQKNRELIDNSEAYLNKAIPIKENKIQENIIDFEELLRIEFLENKPRLIAKTKFKKFKNKLEALLGEELIDLVRKRNSKLDISFKENESSVYYQKLRQLIKNYYHNKDTKLRQDYEELFKDTIYQLKRVAEEKFSKRKNHDEVLLKNCFIFDRKSIIPDIQMNFSELLLPKQEAELYEVIVKILFSKLKNNTGEVEYDYLKEIIELVGKEVANINKERRDEIGSLWKYFTNKSDDFNVKDCNSIVIQNFVGFIFKPNSLESITEYLEKKRINKSYIGISFWCLFNGFSSIPKTFTQKIFMDDKKEALISIEKIIR